MITEEQEASLRNELQLLDTLNLELQTEAITLKATIAGLSIGIQSLRNDVNQQALAMLDIARTVGLPVEGHSMATLAAWIKEHWKP